DFESISIGGSITIEEIDIYNKLLDKGNNVIWHWRDNDKDILTKAINTDIYLTSSNAITGDGKIVNMDGTGNRVSSMIFGHKRVYIIVGKNKLVENYEMARERIKNIAGPLNAKRLNRKTPCTITGKCSDCSSEERICKVETVIHKNPGGTEITVCYVDKELGY
ncbi:MAG TPA: LUD domain-containing protein, partial [Tissierellaceae bacterium]